MKLDSLIKDIVQDKNDISDVNINKICTSSKDAKKGSLFVAINGTVNDGHDFINEAVENGASAVISNGKNVSKLSVPNIKVSNNTDNNKVTEFKIYSIKKVFFKIS